MLLYRGVDGGYERIPVTKLDWIAIDHWNTDNFDMQTLVQSRADDGQDLVIGRDYISRGFRERTAEQPSWTWGATVDEDGLHCLAVMGWRDDRNLLRDPIVNAPEPKRHNLRIEFRILPIKHAYLRTIECHTSIALASLLIGNSGCMSQRSPS
jgi:hypothetical protein